jgi:hypothetical protein
LPEDEQTSKHGGRGRYNAILKFKDFDEKEKRKKNEKEKERKRVPKKLKVTETMSQEVSSSSRVVKYLT